MRKRIHWAVMIFLLISLMLSLIPLNTRADGPFDDLTPNEYTFTGRRGYVKI